MKKAKTFKDAVIKTIKDNVKVDTIDPEVKPLLEDIDSGKVKLYDEMTVAKLCYNQFMLFYNFLKAKKLGSSWKGGWMYNNLRISQRGGIYEFRYGTEYYEITKTSVQDITHIVDTFISY